MFFPPKGLFGYVFALRGCLVGFSTLRGFLVVFLPQGIVCQKIWAVGMLPCFDPMKRSDFGTDFRFEKEGILTNVLMEIVAEIVKLMLCF